MTGEMVLHGERTPIDCLSVRDRSWGPRPIGPRTRRSSADVEPRTGTGGVGYSFAVASARDAWLVYSVPGLDDDPVVCGFLLRDGDYGHVLAGQRRMRVDPATGWLVSMEIDAVDDLGRSLEVTGTALSRHWKGQAADSSVRWEWGGHVALGEDQTYLARPVWLHRRATSR